MRRMMFAVIALAAMLGFGLAPSAKADTGPFWAPAATSFAQGNHVWQDPNVGVGGLTGSQVLALNRQIKESKKPLYLAIMTSPTDGGAQPSAGDLEQSLYMKTGKRGVYEVLYTYPLTQSDYPAYCGVVTDTFMLTAPGSSVNEEARNFATDALSTTFGVEKSKYISSSDCMQAAPVTVMVHGTHVSRAVSSPAHWPWMSAFTILASSVFGAIFTLALINMVPSLKTRLQGSKKK